MDKKYFTATCNFCGCDLTENTIFPYCECEGSEIAREEDKLEMESDPDFSPPMTTEEWNEKHPVVYKETAISKDSDKREEIGIINLEVREYLDGLGFCFYNSIFETAESEFADIGLCFDCSEDDARAYYVLLGEAIDKIDRLKKEDLEKLEKDKFKIN
jgi:hypothetical protein